MQRKTNEKSELERKTFVTFVVIPLVALLVGAGVTYLILKTTLPGPLTANGSPITVSGDTIHTAHTHLTRNSSTSVTVDHGKNLPVSLTMYGCSTAPNCTVNLMQNWLAALYGGTLVSGQITNEADVEDFQDVPGTKGANNSVTIQANNPTYPFNMTTPGDVDQGGNNFYVSKIAVMSGGQSTNLSCSAPFQNCSVVIAYCPMGQTPVSGSPMYCH